MGKRGRIFKPAHIKSNTAGTSNEISFSVLDAAKLAMDERHGEARRVQQLGKIDLFSGEREPDYQVMTLSEDGVPAALPNAGAEGGQSSAGPEGEPPAPATAQSDFAATPAGLTASYEYEVARTKAVRKFRRGLIVAVACAIVIAIAVVVGFAVSGYFGQRADFSELVTKVEAAIEESEEPVVAMNELLADPASDEAKQTLGSVVENLSGAEQALSNAGKILDVAEEQAGTPSESETVARLSKDIAGRQSMITNGRMILSYLATAQEAMASVDEAWALVASAEEKESSAANLVSQQTNRDIDQALSLASESARLLSQAQEKLDAATEKYPSADLSALRSFLENKSAALQKEVEAIEALKNLDAALARTRQAEYEQLEAKALEARESIGDVDKPIVDAYQSIAADFIEKYEAARTEVAVSDEYLRDFLGLAGK